MNQPQKKSAWLWSVWSLFKMLLEDPEVLHFSDIAQLYIIHIVFPCSRSFFGRARLKLFRDLSWDTKIPFLLPLLGEFVHLSICNAKWEKCAPKSSKRLLPMITSPLNTFLRLDSSSENKLLVMPSNAVLVNSIEQNVVSTFFHITQLRNGHSDKWI